MFLNTLIHASIQGGLIILVLFFGLKLVPALSPKVRLWLWRIVFLKLAFSLLPLGAISLKVLPPPPQAPVEAMAAQADDGTVPDSNPAPTRSRSDSWVMAWIAGATVAGIFSLWRARSYHEKIGFSRVASNTSIPGTVATFLEQLGSRKTPQVMVSGTVPTAIVMGSRYPTILLPEDLEQSEDLRLILAHEVAHIAHRDLEWNAFTSLVESLFFFHPLVWLAARSVNQAQEAAADATAVRLTNTSPKRYGEMLMRATLFNPTQPAGALSIGASTSRIRTRLNDLRHVNARPTLSRILAAAVLSLAVIAMTPAYQLSARDSQTTPPPARAAGGRTLVPQRRHKPLRRSHSKARRAKPGSTLYTFRTRKGVRSFRMNRSGRAAVAPAAPQAVTISVRPAVARGVSMAIAAEPARPAAIAAAPRAAIAAGVLAPQRRVGRSATRPARGETLAPQAAESATEITIADAPASSHSTSVSVSSIAVPAAATSVSIASSAPRAISVTAAPAVAAAPRAITIATATPRPAAPTRRTVRVRKGTRISHGNGVSQGTGSSRGTGVGTSSSSSATGG